MAEPDNTPLAHEGQIPAAPPEQADPAQQSLVGALRSSFAVLRLVMIVLVLLYLLSGIFRIEPGDQGVIVRLGQLVINQDQESPYYEQPIFGQGWIWWTLPEPFDEQILLSGRIHKITNDTFLFQRRQEDIDNKTDIASLRPTGRTLKPGVDGAMLTGDKNLSHALWEVEYRIENAAEFVQHIGEDAQAVEPLMQRLLDSAVLRETAYRTVEEVTREKRDIIAGDVQRRLQASLDELEVGVAVVEVTANSIVPPQVAPAFDEVTRAENQKKQLENTARQQATEMLNAVAGPEYELLLEQIERYGAAQLAGADPERLRALRQEIDEVLPQAQGEVAARLRRAEALANSIREEISREFEQFTYWLAQYRQFPRQTKLKLWSRMQQQVLGSPWNEVFWVPSSDVIEILVNRDPQRAIEAERQRLLGQFPEVPE